MSTRLPTEPSRGITINIWLVNFADKLEQACVKTIEDGKMTKDLALITSLKNPVALNSQEFIQAIRRTLEESLS